MDVLPMGCNRRATMVLALCGMAEAPKLTRGYSAMCFRYGSGRLRAEAVVIDLSTGRRRGSPWCRSPRMRALLPLMG